MSSETKWQFPWHLRIAQLEKHQHLLQLLWPELHGNPEVSLFTNNCFQASTSSFDESFDGYRTSEFILRKAATVNAGDVISIDITHPGIYGQDFCIYDVKCSDNNDFLTVKTTTDSSFDPQTDAQMYDALITYGCGPGRVFEHADASTSLTQEFHCDWDGQWKPQDTLLPCNCKYRKSFQFAFSADCVKPIDKSNLLWPNNDGLAGLPLIAVQLTLSLLLLTLFPGFDRISSKFPHSYVYAYFSNSLNIFVAKCSSRLGVSNKFFHCNVRLTLEIYVKVSVLSIPMLAQRSCYHKAKQLLCTGVLRCFRSM